MPGMRSAVGARVTASKRERALQAKLNSSRAKHRRTKPDDREPSTRKIALGGAVCWCGEPFGHDWPGKDAGVAHPRDSER